jgi:hypothetical protein
MIKEIPMTPLLIAALGVLMVATAFLSGLFGMAGGRGLIHHIPGPINSPGAKRLPLTSRA